MTDNPDSLRKKKLVAPMQFAQVRRKMHGAENLRKSNPVAETSRLLTLPGGIRNLI